MSLHEELDAEVGKIFRERWTVTKGIAVPESEDIGMANEGRELDATVLYADLAESTNLVNQNSADFAGEVYKSYLHCAAKIIRSEGGVITAYDGDRIMAVYLGDTKNSSAVRTALKINYAVREIINPGLKAVYKSSDYIVQQVVGIDRSLLRAARTGVRGANDLVWIGPAANYAAKLSALGGYPTNITDRVYSVIMDSVKTTNGQTMWERFTWPATGETIHRSTWQWPF